MTDARELCLLLRSVFGHVLMNEVDKLDSLFL